MIHPDLAHLATPIASLKMLPGNPRRGDVEAVARSYLQFGQRKPIVARHTRKGDVVIAGNHQLAAARQLGWSEMAVVWVDDDDLTAKAFALADNHTAELGDYDLDLLAAMISEVSADADLFAATAYTTGDLADLLSRNERAGLTDPDDVPESAPPLTKPGDLWLLGRHRVLCGDSTVAEDVARLMDGAKAVLMATDPPYGVNVDHTWRDRAGLNDQGRLGRPWDGSSGRLAGAAKGRVTNDDRVDWTDAYRLADVEVALVWHGAIFAGEVGDNLTAAGFDVLEQIIWNKPVHVLGRSYYHWKHESAWFARRHGRAVPWLVGRDQVTVWDEASPKQIFSKSHDDKTEHPTQKPVALFTRPITNHVKVGAGVYDPFAGSGTAAIACEQLGRVAYLMEIDPRYVDVICRRYQEHTGEVPVAEATGNPHDFTR